MSQSLLIGITVGEVLALVLVLGASLVFVARRLRSIGDAFEQAGGSLEALERELSAGQPAGAKLNLALVDAATALRHLVEAEEHSPPR